MIDNLAIPADLKHIAIIMDGNGRWAKKRSKERAFGHRSGSNAVESTAISCAKKGLEVLSLFAFSTENWDRPKKEVDALMNLFADFIKQKNIGLIANFPDLTPAMKEMAANQELRQQLARNRDQIKEDCYYDTIYKKALDKSLQLLNMGEN